MKKILTIILDGFGIREEENGNAVKAANMDNFNKLWNDYPHSLLYASEEKVGLSIGQVGNSEVGHMTIGAGRLVKQSENIVNDFLKEDYKTNEKMQDLLKDNSKTVHLMGLCSDGNVHAGIDDFINMYNILVENGFTNINFDLITDGRDTDIHSAPKYIDMIQNEINKNHIGKISSICGRYYAMDRDDNYDRTEKYYNLLTKGIGIGSIDIKKTIFSLYEKNITDEFLHPILVNLDSVIKDNDIIIWLNYRADRSKQILNSFVNSSFDNFNTVMFNNLKVYTFFPFDKKINTINFMDAPNVTNPLGLYLSTLNLSQARIAESEKYPHVTYFFDGGYNGKVEKCDKFEIPSPEVATYDLKPEMSCVGVTKKVINAMEKDYDFILVNYANPDMVGHTGSMDAATKACMAVDLCLGKLLEVADDNFYKVVLLADHGNVDTMINDDGSICTTHSLAKVPFIIRDNKVILKKEGDLTMVAPTILNYMEIAIPKEMQDTKTLISE